MAIVIKKSNVIKVYAEVNAPNTCLTTDNLLDGALVLGNGEYNIKCGGTTNGILILDNNGNASIFGVPAGTAGYNKLLATDTYGNLMWIDRPQGEESD